MKGERLMTKSSNISRRRTRVAGIGLVVALVVATASILIASFSAASSVARGRHAHTASAHSVLPTGSALAATDTHTEAFVNHDPNGEVCVNAVTEGANAVVGACGRRASVEQEGLVDVSKGPKGIVILALLPSANNGLSVTDRDGSVHQLSVTNGAVLGEDADPSTVTFETPNGSKTIDVGAMAAQLGSSF
jgi:hypothetical protein